MTQRLLIQILLVTLGLATLTTSVHALSLSFDSGISRLQSLQIPGATSGSNCKVAGCSGEMCVPFNSLTNNSICIVREEAACLHHARCEVQADGQCGWTQTPESQACQNGSSLAPTPQPTPTLTPTPTPAPTNYTLHQRRRTRTNSSIEQATEIDTHLEQSDPQGEVVQTFDPAPETQENSSQSTSTSSSPLGNFSNSLRRIGGQLLFPFFSF